MEKNKTSLNSYIKEIESYIRIVSRVHGNMHPEIKEVEKIYDRLISMILDKNENVIDIDKEFYSLRKITNNYTIPEDVCESYERVYYLLEELDKEYHK